MSGTLLLDLTLWDLVADINGNIAVATVPYSTAQDVASAARIFLGEYYYDATIGVPYFQNILGKFPSLAFMKTQLVKAALTVPGVSNPVVFFTGLQDRKLTGQIQFTDATGQQQVASF